MTAVRTKMQSVFWQTIIIMTTALVLLLVSLGFLVGYMNVHQKTSDRSYFQMEVRSRAENIEEQLRQLKITAAQVTSIEALQRYLQEDDVLSRWEHQKVLLNLQKVFISQENLVTSMDLFQPDGERYTALQVDYTLSEAVRSSYDLTDPENTEAKFILIRSNPAGQHASFGFVVPMHSIFREGRLGTMALFGSARRLVDSDEYVSVYLVDADGRCYPDSMPEEWDAEVGLSYGLTARFVQEKEYINASENVYHVILIVMAAFSLMTLLVTGLVLMRELTHPVMRIRQQMERIQQGKQELVTIERGGVELRDLSDGINGMLATIEKRNQENVQVHDKLYQAELARVQARLYALRSQINPHFLYNTLQMVQGIALCNDVPQIARIATGMAGIFRYSIQEEALATAEEEMAVVRLYMEIMNMRHTGRFRYEEEMEPGLEKCMIPRMIVQPVVENAVKYAFPSAGQPAKISVRWKREGEDVMVFVSDNGCGIPEEQRLLLEERIRKPFAAEKGAGSIGLHNIHQRLFLRWGSGCGVEILPGEDGGSCIRLRMKYTLTAEGSAGAESGTENEAG